jgi:hypothetical protein
MYEPSSTQVKENDMLNNLLIKMGLKSSIEDKFFENYINEQKLMAMRSVYTAGTRGTKPGVGMR